MNWIPVSEKLPDCCGLRVILCAVNEFGQKSRFMGFTGYMEKGFLEFHSLERGLDLSVWKVTHWMELPEFPKEDINDL